MCLAGVAAAVAPLMQVRQRPEGLWTAKGAFHGRQRHAAGHRHPRRPGATGTGGTGANDPREELRGQLEAMGKAAGQLLEQLVKVPATLAQIPMQALPEDAATHARNAATEGFAAVKTLLDTMAKGVDEVMKAQRERMANQGSTHTGVGGTTGRRLRLQRRRRRCHRPGRGLHPAPRQQHAGQRQPRCQQQRQYHPPGRGTLSNLAPACKRPLPIAGEVFLFLI